MLRRARQAMRPVPTFLLWFVLAGCGATEQSTAAAPRRDPAPIVLPRTPIAQPPPHTAVAAAREGPPSFEEWAICRANRVARRSRVRVRRGLRHRESAADVRVPVRRLPGRDAALGRRAPPSGPEPGAATRPLPERFGRALRRVCRATGRRSLLERRVRRDSLRAPPHEHGGCGHDAFRAWRRLWPPRLEPRHPGQ
jgi:hypothetical protein